MYEYSDVEELVESGNFYILEYDRIIHGISISLLLQKRYRVNCRYGKSMVKNKEKLAQKNEMDNGKEEQKNKELDFYKKTAIIVGLLFIIATATAIISIVFMGTTLEDSDYLTKVSENETNMIISVIFWIILAVSVAGIGFFMYPILKKYHEGLAQGYVAFRLIETVLILIAAISLMALLTLSQEFVEAEVLDPNYYETSGTVLKAVFDWSFIIGTMIFLGLGGLVLYYISYQLKLVPSWLSIWGFIGAACVTLYGLISLFGHDPAFLAAPIAIQEMVFAIWLIVKGFDTSALIS
jgi:hypothetical protein